MSPDDRERGPSTIGSGRRNFGARGALPDRDTERWGLDGVETSGEKRANHESQSFSLCWITC